MQNASSQLPLHMQLALDEQTGALARLDLAVDARMAVFRYCAISASAQSVEWVELVGEWGVDIDQDVVMQGFDHSQNWLWYALARGKVRQAAALVRAGSRRLCVDSAGKSGLGVLLENTYHDHLDRVLGVIEQMGDAGVHWKDFPDALAFDSLLRKNVGASLSELLARRQHDCLSSQVAEAVAPVEFHRL